MATPFHYHLCCAFNFLFDFVVLHVITYVNTSLSSLYMFADPIEFSLCYIVEHVSMLEMYK